MLIEHLQVVAGRRGIDPTLRPEHPWPASIAVVSGVVLLIIVLAVVSTFR